MKSIFSRLTALGLSSVILILSVLYLSHQDLTLPEQESSGCQENSGWIIPSFQKKLNYPTVAVWVPYMSLDLGGTDKSEKQYRQKISAMFSKISSIGADTVIFHVRPFCDALYRSVLFPSSHIIAGKQGEALSYDPLKIALEEAHQQKLQLHAWINPLRISTDQTPTAFADNHPVIIWKKDHNSENDHYFFTSGKLTCLDPAFDDVRKLIIDGVRELVEHYELDGIQIDDYFYPENDMHCDDYSYQNYLSSAGENALTRAEWRKNNINELVSGMYEAAHYGKHPCLFGIAPQCNTDNDRNMGADVDSWCTVDGYADYLCPQIYVSEDHPTHPFEDFVREWKQMCESSGKRLYAGLALYKIGTDADNGTWLNREDNLLRQSKMTAANHYSGLMFYSYDQLMSAPVHQDVKAAAEYFRESLKQSSYT